MKCYNEKHSKKYNKEVSFASSMCIDQCKPSINEIVAGKLKIVINECKVIKTCNGNRIILKGCKITEIRYKPKGECRKIEKAIFKQPFFEFIPIDKCSSIEICNIIVTVEYCNIYKCTNRCFQLFSLINIEVEIKENKTICCNNTDEDCLCGEEYVMCCDNFYSCEKNYDNNQYMYDREEYLEQSKYDIDDNQEKTEYNEFNEKENNSLELKRTELKQYEEENTELKYEKNKENMEQSDEEIKLKFNDKIDMVK